MPEASQYLFTNKELLELLIKEAGVREGRWVLMATFGIAHGPSPDRMSPGTVVAINQMGIQLAGADTPEGMGMDAAEVNPPIKKR